jgi:hypothetical protein
VAVHAEAAAAVEAVTAVAVMAAVTAVAVMAAVTAVAVMAAVTAVAVIILNLLLLTSINLLEQKVGKIEVMEILPKILTLKMAEVEEKEVLQAILKYLKKGIKNPFFVILKLFCLSNQYLILV